MHHITMADGFSIDQVVQYCDLHFSSILKALNMASNAKSNIIVQNLLKELVCLHCLVMDSFSTLLQIETSFILHWLATSIGYPVTIPYLTRSLAQYMYTYSDDSSLSLNHVLL